MVVRKMLSWVFLLVSVAMATAGEVKAAEQAYAWTKTFGGTSDDRVNSVAVDSSGNVYLAGYFNLTVDFDSGAGTDIRTIGNGNDIFVSKYDATGAYLWTKAIGGSGSDSANSVTIDSTGNVYVAGGFQSTVDFDPGAGTDNRTSTGGYDIFVSKYDTDGNYLWTKTIGGSGDDLANSVALDIGGKVYIAGSFNGTVDFDPGAGTDNRTGAGGGDIFFSQYDTSGNYFWTKAVGGAAGSVDAAKAVTADSFGNIYVAGYFYWTVDFDPGAGTDNRTSVNSALNQLFVSKYDSGGNYIWTKSVTGTYNDGAYAVAVDTDSNVYIAGFFRGTVDFDPGPGADVRVDSGSNDIFVTKYDAGGNYIWTRAVGGTGADGANSVAVDTSGNVYIAGLFYATVDFDPGAGNDNRTGGAGAVNPMFFISKYNAAGSYLWTKSGQASSDARSAFANSIALDSNSNIYLAGYFYNTVDFFSGVAQDNKTSVGTYDAFFSKYAPDSSVPAAPVITDPLTGSATNNAHQPISGTAEAWTTITVYRDAVSQGTVSANSSGAWSFTPGSAWTDGEYSITATATDEVNNLSDLSGVVTFTIDTGVPTAPVVTNPITGTVTIDTRTTITGTAEALATITVYRNGVSQGTVSADANGVWDYTPGTAWPDSTYTVTAKATDWASNTSVASNTVILTIDAGIPAAPTFVDPPSGSARNNARPVISGISEPLATIAVYRDGVSQGTVSANGSGVWSYTPGSEWLDGIYSLSATATDVAYNTSVASSVVTLTIDTGIPSAPVITNPLMGSVTNNAQAAISGTAEPLATIGVYRNGLIQGMATASGGGAWSYSPASVWADGTYSLSATATDLANNTSATSSAVTLSIDTGIPAAPVITSPATGSVTTDAKPVISGIAEGLATISIFRNGVSGETVSADANGVWHYTPGSVWSDGTYSVTAKATDGAGNTSSGSSSVIITLDAGIPAAPVITIPVTHSATNDTRPTISGTAEAWAIVRLYRDGVSQGTTTANGSGAWNYISGSPWPDAIYHITAAAIDLANNTSNESSSVTLTIDTGIPAAPMITRPAMYSATTSNSRPTIGGTAEAAARITVYRDSVSQGIAVTNSAGVWKFTPLSDWSDGTYRLTAAATDAASNTSNESLSLRLTIGRDAMLCSEWNGYLGMYNVLEYVNLAADSAKYTTTLYSRAGQAEGSVNFSVAGGGEYDLLVHDLNGFENSGYGKVCTTATNGDSGELDGRMVFYKPDSTNGGYQFAFAMPLGNGITGTQYVPYNTYQPSLDPEDAENLAANWIQLTNLSTAKQTGALVFYDREGEVIVYQAVTLKAGERFDFSAHDIVGPKHIGLVEWIPKVSTARFQLRNVRYYYRADGVDVPLGDDFDSAFQLEGIVGSGQLLTVPLDAQHSSAVLEFANTLNEAVSAEVRIYPAAGGKALHQQIYKLKPHATYHLIVDSFLRGEQGIATVKGSKPSSIMATAMQYGRNVMLGIQTVYGIQASEALGTVMYGSYNTYLKQACRLLLVNPTSSETLATVSMKRYDGTEVNLGQVLSVPAHGLTDYDLCSQDQENVYGVATVQTEDPNTIFATVLRIGEGEQYRFPTPMRE